jgi:2-polyprenyl-3-methyl-5-hydroxy-6-metoxy-1,4-benzoquinol methylase
MAIIRVKHNNFEQVQDAINSSEARLDEWGGDDNRIKEPSWEYRYKYEAGLITPIITENKFKTVLELGSGPGSLSVLIQDAVPYDLTYHLVDKPCAKEYFDKNKLKGTFFIQDFSTALDTTILLPKYDLIICNDTLEHLYAPANVIRQCYHLMNDTSFFFISVPNWRMAHQFIYRDVHT